jgi:hypothetical protein
MLCGGVVAGEVLLCLSTVWLLAACFEWPITDTEMGACKAIFRHHWALIQGLAASTVNLFSVPFYIIIVIIIIINY